MAKPKSDWPPWWEWELKLTDHLFETMERREFTEVDLRRMMKHALAYRRDSDIDTRWVIETRFRGAEWVVIVEPQEDGELLDVITAFAEDSE